MHIELEAISVIVRIELFKSDPESSVSSAYSE